MLRPWALHLQTRYKPYGCVKPTAHMRICMQTHAHGHTLILYSYVTGFEITRLPRTQQEDILFTITR